MGELSHNSALLTRYLLGDLSSDEQDRLEEQYFSDDELFIELLDAKDQLTSDYLENRLAPANRERFERHFLTQSDCHQELELDRFLQPEFRRNSLPGQSASREEAPPWWQAVFIGLRAYGPLAGAAIVALLIIGATGLWSALRPSSEKPGSVLSQSSPPVFVGPITASLALKPGRLRSEGEMPKAIVGAGTQTVELQLEAGAGKYDRYQASLQRVDEGNVEVLADSALKAETAAGKLLIVTWKVPAAKLSIGDYQVTLRGVSADNSPSYIGDYSFKVRDR